MLQSILPGPTSNFNFALLRSSRELSFSLIQFSISFSTPPTPFSNSWQNPCHFHQTKCCSAPAGNGQLLDMQCHPAGSRSCSRSRSSSATSFMTTKSPQRQRLRPRSRSAGGQSGANVRDHDDPALDHVGGPNRWREDCRHKCPGQGADPHGPAHQVHCA